MAGAGADAIRQVRGQLMWLAVALAWGGPACGLARAQGTKDRAPITAAFADWQKRQKAMKTVRYTISGTAEFLKPLGSDAPEAPKGDRTRPYQATVLLDLERQRVRAESTEFFPAEGGKYLKRAGTITFNGGEVRQGQSPEVVQAHGGFDLLIAKKPREGEPGSQFENRLWPILFAHGFIPTVHQPPYVERLPQSLQVEDFVTHGRHTLRGLACQVFRTEPQGGAKGISDEYWVKPDQQSAILRYVHLSGGQPYLRIDIDWGESAVGWMPRGWTHALTSNGKDVDRLYKLTVDRMEIDPVVADADFTIPARPGMKQVIVGEQPPPGVRVHPGQSGRRTYRITDDGEWVETGSQGWKSHDEKTTIPLPSRWGWWPWVVGVGIIVLFSGAVVYRRRGRRAAAA